MQKNTTKEEKSFMKFRIELSKFGDKYNDFLKKTKPTKNCDQIFKVALLDIFTETLVQRFKDTQPHKYTRTKQFLLNLFHESGVKVIFTESKK